MRSAIFSKAVVVGVVLLGFLLVSCTVNTHPTAPPPPPKIEVRVSCPPGYFWVKGHWAWRHGHYVWVPGKCMRIRPGYVWVPGHWERRGRVWVWIPGHWKRIK